MGETHGVDLDCVIAGGSWRARRAQRLLRVAQKTLLTNCRVQRF